MRGHPGPDRRGRLEAPTHRGRARRARPARLQQGVARPAPTASSAVPLRERLPALAAWPSTSPRATRPRQAVRRQVMLFTGAFGVLLVRHRGRHRAHLAPHPARDRDGAAQIGLRGQRVSRPEDAALGDPHVRRDAGDGPGAPTRRGGRSTTGVIARESERLSRLIDNVLDFARIEGGPAPYDVVPTAVEPLSATRWRPSPIRWPAGGFKVDVARGRRTCPRCRWTPRPSARPSPT